MGDRKLSTTRDKSEHKPSKLTARLYNVVSRMSEDEQIELLGRLSEHTRKFTRKELVLSANCEAKGSVSCDFILDISEAGVFLETTRLLDIGEKVLLSFSLPKTDRSFRLPGRVVWKNIHGIGVKFDVLTPLQNKQLKAFLKTV
jgi:Tfp pilus assembly protein PilZ